MQLETYERLILSACFQSKKNVAALAQELPDNSFGYGLGGPGEGHQLIYRSILSLYQDGKPIDIVTVADSLGTALKKVGGEAYLVRISDTAKQLGITSTNGLPQWAEIVDKAGRIRRLLYLTGEFANKYQDVESAVSRIDDLDVVVNELQAQISNANTVRSTYRPISEAGYAFRRNFDAEIEGNAVSWIPMGWEATKKFNVFPRSALTTITGLSSIGKTQFLIQGALGVALQLRHGNMPGVVVINTYEMSGEKYAARMAASLAGVNLKSVEVRRKGSPAYRRLMETSEFIDSLPIVYDDGDMTSAQIVTDVIGLDATSGGVHFLGVDYSELVPDVASSEELRVSAIFRNGLRVGRILDAAVVILSQVSGSVLSSDSKIAGPWATRYSRAAWHASKLMIEIYNPIQMKLQPGMNFTVPDYLDDGKAYGLVSKNTNGPTGHFAMDWTPGFTRFSDPSIAGFGMSTLYEHLQEIWDQWQRSNSSDF